MTHEGQKGDGDNRGDGEIAVAEGPFASGLEGVPDFVAARDHVVDELVRFARSLRRADAQVPANAVFMGARALVEVGFEQERVRAALRASFVTRREDLETFEWLFPEFWRRLSADPESTGAADSPGPDAAEGGLAPLDGRPELGVPLANAGDVAPEERELTVEVAVASEGEGDGDDGETVTTSTYSPTGSPVPVSADPVTEHENDELETALTEITQAIAGLQGRRFARGGDEHVDTRGALRESFSTGGTILSVPRRERKRTAVRCVLLVDVSQSVLDTIDRGSLLRFLYAATGRWRHARVFFFDDRVREVTAQFDAATTDDALAALKRAETTWGGGTRIGHAVETLRREHLTAVDRNTVVFVLSDGLEVGEIDRLERGMAWLSRRTRAVLWLNPLAASPEFEPACRGMAASLPYVDGLFAFTGPADVVELARQLRLQGIRGTIGYEQDPRRR